MLRPAGRVIWTPNRVISGCHGDHQLLQRARICFVLASVSLELRMSGHARIGILRIPESTISLGTVPGQVMDRVRLQQDLRDQVDELRVAPR
jgi:hypothetical protein